MALHGPRLLYQILEGPMHRHPWARAVQTFLMLTILVSVIAVCLETVPALGRNHPDVFAAIEFVAILVFAVEYAARLWLCVYSPRIRYQHPVRGRLRYALSTYALVDLAGILPSCIALVTSHDSGS